MKKLILNNKKMKISLVIGIIFLLFLSSIIPMTIGCDTHFAGRELFENSDEYYMFYRSQECPELEKNTYEKTLELSDFSKEKTRASIIKTVEIDPLQTITDGIMDSAWPMFSHDIHHTGRSPYSPTGNAPLLKWKFTINGPVYSSPAIDKNGTIYVGGTADYCLYAINPDGTEKWRGETAFIRSSPAIGDDGTVYVGDCAGYLNAFYPNGSLKWKCKCGNNWVFSSPIIGDDGTIYVGATNNRFYAVNPNGTIKWSYQTGFKIYSSAAIDDNGIIYIGSHDGNLYAFYPNGTVKWKYKTYGEVKCPPAIGDDGTIYVGSWGGELNAIYPNGTRKWQFYSGDAVETSPAIASDGTIYFGSYNGLFFSISPNGTENWRFRAGSGGSDGWIISSPAIDNNGIIYVGSINGKMFALNPDGTLKWKYDTEGDIGVSPAIGDDGTIYFGSLFHAPSRANLYAIEVIDNQPPGAPSINGPQSGETEIAYDYTFNAIDPDGDNVKYIVNWGDGDTDTTNSNPSGTNVTINHSWNTDGTYMITAKAQDKHGLNGPESTLQVTIALGNQPPGAPNIDGQMDGKAGIPYEYTFSATDPEVNDVSYYVKWGDDNITNWTSFQDSGTPYSINHTWSTKGLFTIEAKAKDTEGAESDWTELEVSMPKNKAISSLFIQFLENHPRMFPIFRQLLGL